MPYPHPNPKEKIVEHFLKANLSFGSGYIMLALETKRDGKRGVDGLIAGWPGFTTSALRINNPIYAVFFSPPSPLEGPAWHSPKQW